jgi:hypothetical protein
VEMDYLTVLHVRLGAKIGNLHGKDSNSFRNRLISSRVFVANRCKLPQIAKIATYAGFADLIFRPQ